MKIRINSAYQERGGDYDKPYQFKEFTDWNEAMPELFKLHGRLIVDRRDDLDDKDKEADYYVTLYNDYVE